MRSWTDGATCCQPRMLRQFLYEHACGGGKGGMELGVITGSHQTNHWEGEGALRV